MNLAQVFAGWLGHLVIWVMQQTQHRIPHQYASNSFRVHMALECLWRSVLGDELDTQFALVFLSNGFSFTPLSECPAGETENEHQSFTKGYDTHRTAIRLEPIRRFFSILSSTFRNCFFNLSSSSWSLDFPA